MILCVFALNNKKVAIDYCSTQNLTMKRFGTRISEIATIEDFEDSYNNYTIACMHTGEVVPILFT